MLEKSLKFVPNKKDNIVTFNLSLVLFSAKIDLILEEASCKKNVFKARDTGHVKMAFALVIKVVALYMEATIHSIKWGFGP